MLAAKLGSPISWTANDPEIDGFLQNLQGDILKGHGRNNAVFMFCRFRDDACQGARAFLRAQIARLRSAKHQLLAVDHKRCTGERDPAPFLCLFLSKEGYDYFGIPDAIQPADPAFRAGMAAATLGDPPPSEWDSRLRAPHLLLLVAVSSPDAAQRETTDLLDQMALIGDVESGQSGEIIGNQFFNDAGHGVENFGYVDGRSQPIVLTEEIPAEGGIDIWPKNEFPVSQFVVPDPAVENSSAYGSYFVFRQLEQDVRGFRSREDELTAGRDATFPNRDSAGVGRLESGTPFELTGDDGGTPNITNDFAFATPHNCPHFAHIRKVNPRTDDTRKHLMIRRGITYGTRDDAHPKPGPKPGDGTMLVLDDTAATATLPTGGVGLLFQSYQADIGAQFETTQGWANDTGNGGVDPVIGQVASALLDWPESFGSAVTTKEEFYSRAGKPAAGPYVKLRGGGYFFAPSLPFLQSL